MHGLSNIRLQSTKIQLYLLYIDYPLYLYRLAVDWVSCYMDSVTSVCSPREYNYIFHTLIILLTFIDLQQIGFLVTSTVSSVCSPREYNYIFHTLINFPLLLQTCSRLGYLLHGLSYTRLQSTRIQLYLSYIDYPPYFCRLAVDWVSCYINCFIRLQSTRIQLYLSYIDYTPYFCRLAVDWVSCYMESVTSVCSPREYNYIFHTLINSPYFCRLAVDLGYLLHGLSNIRLQSTRTQLYLSYIDYPPYLCRLAVDWVTCYINSVSSVCSPREYNYIFHTLIIPFTLVDLQQIGFLVTWTQLHPSVAHENTTIYFIH